MDTERGDDTEFRLILVGKSGGGRSATGNTILGSQKAFESIVAAKTTTQKCQRGQGTWQDMKISLVDTSAMFDADGYKLNVRQEIMACIQLSWPGPHAFILVTQVGRFTAEDAAAAKCVWEIFGAESARHMIVLFTCVEDLGGDSLQEYVHRSDNKNLRNLIRQCGNRFCGFNNKATGAEQENQVSELMVMVQRIVSQNGGRYYVNQLYLQDEHVQMFIKQNQKSYRRSINRLSVCFLPFCLAFCVCLKNVFVVAFSCVRSAFARAFSCVRSAFAREFSCVRSAFARAFSCVRSAFARAFSCVRRVFAAAFRYFFS